MGQASPCAICHQVALKAMTDSMVDDIWDTDPNLPYDDAVKNIVGAALHARVAEYLSRTDCSLLHDDWY